MVENSRNCKARRITAPPLGNSSQATTINQKMTMKNIVKKKLTNLIGATLAVCSYSSNAAITVVDSYQHTSNSAISGTTDASGLFRTITNASVGNLVASGSAKLVVGVNSRSNIPFTVTYGGVAMTPAVSQASSLNSGFAAVFYLDNPMTDGDFVFTSAVVNNFDRANLHAWALSGTAVGGPVGTVVDTSSTGNPIDMSITTGASGGFVIGSIGANGGTPTTTFTPDSGSDFLYAFANTNSNGYAAWLGDTSGTYSMLRTNTSTAGGAGVMATFAPIPEPSAALLGGIGMLLMMRRRRQG